jgi:hypothetical protein
VCKMESRFDIVTIVNAICVAGYVAIMLGYAALYDFGFCGEVRRGALIAAILIAALVAIEFFGKKLGNAK